MNWVKSFVNRQGGFAYSSDYDIALYRLKCYQNDVFRGIGPINEIPEDSVSEAPIFTIRFCTTPGYEHVLALANEDGKIGIQNTEKRIRENYTLQTFQAHNNVVFDVAWMPSELKLVTASGDHSVGLFDVSRPEISHIRAYQGHTRSVKSVVFRHMDNATFATGARDGAIMLWDIRANHGDKGKPDNCILNAHGAIVAGTKRRKAAPHLSRSESVTGLAFQDDFTLLSCAAGDGSIKAWDLRKNYTLHKKEPVAKHVLNSVGIGKKGFTSLLMCPYGITVYASCMNNSIYAYNVSSTDSKPFAEFYGHLNTSFYLKTCLSPDGKYISSGSKDEFAYIWHTKRPGAPLLKLVGHAEEVTCVAWCNVGETKIVTCSDDSTHRIWRICDEKQIENELVEIQGKVQIGPFLNSQRLNLETTPKMNYRHEHSSTPGSDVTSGYPSSSKRSHEEMNSDFGSEVKNTIILSPIYENQESSGKRPHMEMRGPRRLFSSDTSEHAGERSRGYESDGVAGASSSNLEQNIFSPTSNLPNFVIDGTAPHLLERSPRKYKENIDWLTKMRKQKLDQGKSKVPLDKPKTPNRRATRARSSEPGKSAKSPSNSLLNFFKIQNLKETQESKSPFSPRSPKPTTSQSLD